jgi:LacI family transcriptional regulator
LCHSSLDPEKEKAEIDMLVGSRVEGLIVASEQPEKMPHIFDELTENGMAFVLVDRFFPERDFPSVVVDDLAVGRIAAEHLIGLGHRRIGHIQGPRLSPASLRRRGFVQTLQAHGISVSKESIVRGNFDISSGREAMIRLLKNTSRLTAVFAANDPMAIGALYACRDAGLQVPADISIMGAGNIEGADHPNPFLTTMDWPRQQLGRAAAESLLAAMSHRADRAFTVRKVFQPKLLVRQSSASPSS